MWVFEIIGLATVGVLALFGLAFIAACVLIVYDTAKEHGDEV